MSEVMQQGILRMPPECWMNGQPLDERQRHSTYVAAADRILELERELAVLREQIAALGEIACLNLDDSTVGKCDAITGKGEKYKDVLRRIFAEQPKQIATLRGLLVEARDAAFPASITQKGISNALLDYRRELYQRIKEALKETQS